VNHLCGSLRIRTRAIALAAILVLGLIGAVSADAQSLGSAPFGSGSGVFHPLVPVSAFARPSAWFDPSHLQISTSFSVGSGWGGLGSSALQVTSLRYQFGNPLAMRVSLGNAFGAGAADNGKMFLEGLDVAYRPFSSLQLQVHYQNIRSPLQLDQREPFFDYAR
jgi:hypothetical protein